MVRPLAQPRCRTDRLSVLGKPRSASDGDVAFRVDKQGGQLQMLPAEGHPDHRVVVMVGNAVIHRPSHESTDAEGRSRSADELIVKANSIVAWIDRKAFPALDFEGADSSQGENASGLDLGHHAHVVPEFVLGIYAEGAVELRYGEQRLRGQSLYLDPHRYVGLMIEPRFDGKSRGLEAIDANGIPLHVRARTARLVSKGRTVFHNAEVATSRSDDRIALRIQQLTVDEAGTLRADDGTEISHFLGYQGLSTQAYDARGITVHAERLPLFYAPEASFGVSDLTSAYPTGLRGVRLGNRGHLGQIGFAQFGGQEEAQGVPYDWLVEVGGYTRRGPALAGELSWDSRSSRRGVRGFGKLTGFGVWEQADEDRSGYRPPELRHRLTAESRTWLGRDLTADVEFNELSDRGVNPEYFEIDDLEHKDRESYGRLRWAPRVPGNVVGTLIAKWHQRDFVTETTELPAAGLWVASQPLLRPRRRGALGLDLISESHAGSYTRRFDIGLPDEDYSAWRVSSTTSIHAGASVDDVRLSGYVGVAADQYLGVDHDTIADISRTALIGGANANVQLHRDDGIARGGWFELDGLRHVMDLDVGYETRQALEREPAALPFFDRRELAHDHHAAIARFRSRWLTRRRDEGMRTLFDVEFSYKHWFDDVGPYGQDGFGLMELRAEGEPREGLRVWGEAQFSLGDAMETAAMSIARDTTIFGYETELGLGYRYVRDRSQAFSVEALVHFSERYDIQGTSHFDWDDGIDVHRLLFHRKSADHRITFGLQWRADENLGFEFAFSPTIGPRSEPQRVFRNTFDPSPRETLGAR